MRRSIDGLRAVAALSVLGYHAWLYTRPHVTARHRESLGDYLAHELRLGLVLFFVLSGYLLYAPWARTALGGRAAPRTWTYAVRRLARIVPAYWLAVLGSIALLWGLDGTPGVRLPEAGRLWTFAVFGQNFSGDTLLTLDPPMWTLAVEVQFYVVLPLLGWLALRCGATRVRQAIVPAAFLVLGVAWNRAIASPSVALPLTKVLPAMAPYFAAGMLAAVLMHERTLSRSVAWWITGLGLAVVAGDAAWAADAASRGSHDLLLHVVRDLPAGLGFAALVAAVAHAPREPRPLAWQPLASVGTISYGVYLWHVPLMLWLRGHGMLPSSAWLAVALVLPLVLAVAATSWFGVERPAQRRARALTTRRRDEPRRPVEVVPPGRPEPEARAAQPAPEMQRQVA